MAGYTYKDGKIIAKLSLTNTKGGRINELQCVCKKRIVYSAGCSSFNGVMAIAKEFIQDCGDNDFPIWHFEPGLRCDNFQIINGPYYENECWEVTNPTDPENPPTIGGPNVTPTWSWGPDTYIINSLKSPCLTNVLNEVIGANYVNEVQDIVRNFGADTTIRITFQQGDLGFGLYGTSHGGPIIRMLLH